MQDLYNIIKLNLRSVAGFLQDSRGSVALLCQHPQEKLSLLIGFGGGRDDDVMTRWKRAAKDNLPTWVVTFAVEDRAKHAQVLRRQICILRMDLERQQVLL